MKLTKDEKNFIVWVLQKYINDCYFSPDEKDEKAEIIIEKLKKAVQ